MEKFLVRQIRKADNKQLAWIIRSVLEEFNAVKTGTVYYDPTTDDLFNLFKTPRSECWMVQTDNEIAGCCGIFPTSGLDTDCCELVKFYFLPQYRGKGLGRLLLRKCFASARRNGYNSIYLESLPELKKAVRLYEQEGFTHLPGPLGNSGHFGCDIWMIKRLTDVDEERKALAVKVLVNYLKE